MANKYSFKLAMWEMQMKELCKFISPKSKQLSSRNERLENADKDAGNIDRNSYYGNQQEWLLNAQN